MDNANLLGLLLGVLLDLLLGGWRRVVRDRIGDTGVCMDGDTLVTFGRGWRDNCRVGTGTRVRPDAELEMITAISATNHTGNVGAEEPKVS